MKIVRPVFLVPLADNDHGKTNIVRALVAQGLGRKMAVQRKGVRELVSPNGRPVSAYVFGRSYQEVEKGTHGSVLAALDANDAAWRTRELIVMPSHVTYIGGRGGVPDDLDEMVAAAHGAGFDAIVASVILLGDGGDDLADYASAWTKSWDERWRIPNQIIDDPAGQLQALGCDLWTWVCRAMVP